MANIINALSSLLEAVVWPLSILLIILIPKRELNALFKGLSVAKELELFSFRACGTILV